MAATRLLISVEEIFDRFSPDELAARIRALRSQPIGGCDACRFADTFSDRLCTIPDISAEDFDLGVSGMDCLPEALAGRRYYEPTPRGEEPGVAERLNEARRIREEKKGK